MILAIAVIGLLVLAGLAVGREIVRNNYYVTAHDGTVSIMRGISGSILGIRMQNPYLLGCLNDRNELSQISYGQALDNLDCRLMRLQDLRPSERAQVAAGLPGGSLDDAIAQLRELARSSLLPPCPSAADADHPHAAARHPRPPRRTGTALPPSKPAPGTQAAPADATAPTPALAPDTTGPPPAATVADGYRTAATASRTGPRHETAGAAHDTPRRSPR